MPFNFVFAAVILDFNPLPSSQGWTTVGNGGAWSTDGSTLTLDTTGGSTTELATYRMAVPFTQPSSFAFTARVTGKQLSSTSRTGLFFGAYTGTHRFLFFANDASVEVNGNSVAVDTSVFHDYRLDVDPSAATYQLFVDGLLQASGVGSSHSVTWIEFGDGLFANDLRAEITALSFSSFSAVPEPSSILSLATIAVVFAGHRRFRKYQIDAMA